jgi:hypothetical protein
MAKSKRPVYVDGEYKVVPYQKDPDLAAYHSLVRMLVGSILVGSDELLARARAWEEDHPIQNAIQGPHKAESDIVLLRHLIVGAIFHGPQIISRPLLSIADTTDRALGFASSMMGPFMRIPIFRPIQKRWKSRRHQVQALVAYWVETGRREEPYSKAMAQDLIPEIIDDVVLSLSENQAIQTLIQVQVGMYLKYVIDNPTDMDELVQTVADRYIAYLNTENKDTVQELVRIQVSEYLTYAQSNPEELEELVQVIGDRYLDYLQAENPDAIAQIVQGQSIGLVGEIADEVRARTVTSDSVVEMFMRSLLRRPARQELPLPPPEVLEQATLSIEEVIRRRNVEKRNE